MSDHQGPEPGKKALVVFDQLLARMFGYCREVEDTQPFRNGVVSMTFPYRGRTITLRMELHRLPVVEHGGEAARASKNP